MIPARFASARSASKAWQQGQNRISPPPPKKQTPLGSVSCRHRKRFEGLPTGCQRQFRASCECPKREATGGLASKAKQSAPVVTFLRPVFFCGASAQCGAQAARRIDRRKTESLLLRHQRNLFCLPRQKRFFLFTSPMAYGIMILSQENNRRDI